MTVKELIEQLQQVPEEIKDKSVYAIVYLEDGTILVKSEEEDDEVLEEVLDQVLNEE